MTTTDELWANYATTISHVPDPANCGICAEAYRSIFGPPPTLTERLLDWLHEQSDVSDVEVIAFGVIAATVDGATVTLCVHESGVT